ncbi:MAG TPA: chromate efflux transporter [Actinomycetota bacterium]|nr:chromate efflux transporter [Actinomycetota bacterium]
MDDAGSPVAGRGSLGEVASAFLKLGVIGFGGPAAHVALMRREFVEERHWLDEDRFLELFGAANLIPGPASTELGMMLGYLRAGWAGLLVAGACFIAPAMTIVLILASIYVRYGSVPATGWVLAGVAPVMIAIIADALWQLGRRALKTLPLAGVGIAVLLLYLLGVYPIVLLFGGALLVMLGRQAGKLRGHATFLLPVGAATVPLRSIFFEFLKLGAIVYGSGYVLLAFLRSDVVQHLHWLSDGHLVDAVAIGQVTPGPVFTTATFIGYLLAGVPGGITATVAIFLPSFVFAGVVYSLLPRLRRSAWAAAFLDGVTVCGLGLMAGVSIQLGRIAITGVLTAALALAAFVILRRYQPNSAWLVLGGALIGLAARGWG